MAKKEIRSKYIQNAMSNADQLVASMQDVVTESVRSFLGAGVKEQLKQVLNEGTEDEFEIEEVPDTEEVANEPEEGADGDNSEDDGADNTEDTESKEDDATADGGEIDSEEVTVEDGDGEEDVWSEIAKYRNADGEYDLSKCEDGDCVARVLKVLTDEDGVRVAQDDNGTITLTDDNTEQEYIIDLGTGGDDPVSESAVNLGYTDDYQNKTAMTTPSNSEPASKSNTYSMDGGVPTGTENPLGGKGKQNPFDKNVTESDETIEIDLEDEGDEIQETMTTQEQGPFNRGTGMTHTNNNPKAARGRNARSGGEQISGTGESSYSPQQVESIMKRATAIFKENKQLREAVAEIKEQQKQLDEINKKLCLRLEEAKVAFTNVGYMAKCMVENAMTKNEKLQMVQVLSKPTSIEESKRVFEVFTQKLNQTSRPTINLGNAQATQISESRNINGQQNQGNSLNESTGSGMQESISLIERMNSVYGY